MLRPSLTTLALLLFVSMLGTVALAAAQRGRTENRQPAAAQPAAEAPALQPIEQVDPRPAPPRKPADTAIVRLRGSVALRSRPGGRVLKTVGAATQFGSPTALPVVAERAGWVGVTSTDLPNGKLGWVKKKNSALDHERRTRLAIRVDLSSRRMQLVSGDRVLRTATVGIGRPGSATPTGRFAVTDKLNGGNYGAYYGCCIIALSGHQPNLPPGWPGGDRLAIHGTSNPATIGARASAGCLHAGTSALRTLMRRVPLGTPVFIRR